MKTLLLTISVYAVLLSINWGFMIAQGGAFLGFMAGMTTYAAFIGIKCAFDMWREEKWLKKREEEFHQYIERYKRNKRIITAIQRSAEYKETIQ